jgi:hypothetical protein
MKLGLMTVLSAAIIAQAFFSLSNFSVNDGIGIKKIVACSDCDKKTK